jgi:hypothetical protein
MLLQFNRHPEIHGKHAFLSPSSYHWLNYDPQKLQARFSAAMGSRRGTHLHGLAHSAIQLGVPLARSNKALATYVNDALKYRMTCEQPLFYSENCFGTADTISFRRNKLRIHDLKTGINKTSEKQLEVYAALFCLEYGISPFDISIELRIYQREEVREFFPEPEIIMLIMDKIIDADQHLESIKEDQW